jgi:hypothetical protein
VAVLELLTIKIQQMTIESTNNEQQTNPAITYSECYAQPLFSRIWAMPNKNTFDIKPIKSFVEKYWNKDIISIDPFARNTEYATYRNDLNPETNAEYHLHANDFIHQLIAKGIKADLVFFDPPYSPHQTKECYAGFGINMKYEDDARHGWSKTRVSISEILKPNGIVLNFGWDTIGMGKKRGMEIIEIMLVSHGIGHNDTICMAEQKRTLF